MVCVHLSEQCRNGRHEECKKILKILNEPLQEARNKGTIIFGGHSCPCGCHWKEDKDG